VNRLLASLPDRELTRILKCCETVHLDSGMVLGQFDIYLQHVYFPLSGSISVVCSVDGHAPQEVGLVGNEGMLGATLALGVRKSPLTMIVQGPGTALRMTIHLFRSALRENPVLGKILGRYLYVILVQLAQTVACTRFHEVDERLACWLLMTHDRAQSDHFHLTHQHLADMLGVQRSAVTIAAGGLQKRGLISYSRGDIHILDRAGMEAVSCVCYGLAGLAYTRQFSDERV
jgi:CRP-like cAMP-binding protein